MNCRAGDCPRVGPRFTSGICGTLRSDSIVLSSAWCAVSAPEFRAMPVQVTVLKSRISTVLAVTLPSSGKASVRRLQDGQAAHGFVIPGPVLPDLVLHALQLPDGRLELRPLRLQPPELALLEEEQPPCHQRDCSGRGDHCAEPSRGIAGGELLQGRNSGQQELKQCTPTGQPPRGQAEGRRHGGVRGKLNSEVTSGITRHGLDLQARRIQPQLHFIHQLLGQVRAGQRPGSAARSRAVPPAVARG